MITGKTLRETAGILIAYLLVMELMLLTALVYWPELREVLIEISKITRFLPLLEKLIPIDFLKGPFTSLVESDTRYISYVTLQHFFKGVNILGIAASLLLGTFVIAREREQGTLETLLSLPLSRGRILAAKSLVISLGLAGGIFITSLSLVPLSPLFGETIATGPLLLCSLHGTLTVWFFYSLTLLVSTFFRTQASVAFAVGVFIAVEFALYFVQVARSASIFKLCDFDVYYPILMGQEDVPFLRYKWIFILGAILCYLIAHRRFTKGDL